MKGRNARCGRLLVATSVLNLMGASAGAQPSDDFESYALGTFPAPTWTDPGLIDPTPPNPPDPSAIVIETVDAHGSPTKALSIIEAIADTQGLHRTVEPTSRVRMTSDVRIDQWCDIPTTATDDWAIWFEFGLLIPGVDPCCHDENMGVYASSLEKGWRMWWNDSQLGPFIDISLEQPITLGVWYTVQVEYDAVTGWTHTLISDAASGAVLVDRVDLPETWLHGGADFDFVALVDGELGGACTIGHETVLDNVSIEFPCYADCDGSGLLDLFDFLCYQNLFAAGAPRADCDGSGTLDLFDFLCFQNAFAARCM